MLLRCLLLVALGLLRTLLRLRLRLLLRRLSTLRCWLLPLWLLLGLGCALLPLGLLRALLLLCGLSALLRLPPLPLSLFLIVLCVSRY